MARITAESRSTNGKNGRGPGGRFAKGNPGGPGNPHAAKISKLRSALIKAVTLEDIEQVIKMLIEQAKAGEIAAVRELFDRVLGKPVQSDILERLDALEEVRASS